MHQFPHMATKIKSIKPYIRPPWWLPKVQIRMSRFKEDAKALHDDIQELADPTMAIIYTDGSGIEGKIGAAVYSPTIGGLRGRERINETKVTFLLEICLLYISFPSNVQRFVIKYNSKSWFQILIMVSSWVASLQQ